MTAIDEHTAKEGRRIVGYFLLILPAVALGVLDMIWCDVSPVLWGQQIAAFVIFAWLAQPLRRAAGRFSPAVWSVLLLLPLAATLLGTEAGGARRWLDLGVFNVNAAILVLPAMLVMLGSVRCPWPVVLGAAAVLRFQPDLSQLSAFSAAALVVLWRHRKNRLWSVLSVFVLCALVIRCLGVPTAIEPAAHCEGVLITLGERSWLLQAAGWIALAAIPAYWMYRFARRGKAGTLSLAVYYAVTILFTISGEYPVPFAGFGLSSIVGYCLAYAACGAAQKDRNAI